jgi:hypothetical protein
MKKFLQQTALAAGLMALGFGVHAQTITLKVHHFLSAQKHCTRLQRPFEVRDLPLDATGWNTRAVV